MDKPSDAPMILAPGASSGARALRLPAEDEWPPVDEYLDPPEVTRYERVGGRRMVAMPAHAEHAEPHLRLDYLIGAHVREGYVGASDLKTRVSEDDEYASDTCVRKAGIDPKTDTRYLEELVFEIVHKRAPSKVKRRARGFAARGVRRQIGVFVKKGEVCEWDAEEEKWLRLDPKHRIHDRCLALPLEVAALLDVARADVAVALALEAKGNPAIVEMKEESRRKGHAAGLAEGRAEGLAQALLTILAVRGVAVPEAARERILGTQDPETLDRWLLRAGTAMSLEEVLTKDPSGP